VLCLTLSSPSRWLLSRATLNPADGWRCLQSCRVQISVDIFCLCSQYTDLASLGPIAHYTCGQVRHG